MVPDKIGAAYQLSGMVPYQIIIAILQGFYTIIAIRIFQGWIDVLVCNPSESETIMITTKFITLYVMILME